MFDEMVDVGEDDGVMTKNKNINNNINNINHVRTFYNNNKTTTI